MRYATQLSLLAILASVETASAEFRTVFLAPAPIVIEFDVTVEAGPVADQRRKVAEVLVEDNDANQDGQLSREEAAALDPLPGSGGETVEGLWDRIDRQPADDALSVGEVHHLIDRVVGPEIRLNLEQTQAIAAGPLESFLDANDDGIIEVDEYNAGFARLKRVDFDDDDSVSMAELLTYQKNLGEPLSTPPPFSEVSDPELADRVIAAFERNREVRWQRRRWAEIDANDDGSLTPEEVVAWVEAAESDLVVRIDVAPTTGNRIKVSAGEARVKLARPERQRARTRAEVLVGPAGGASNVEFRVKKSFGASDGTAFLKLKHIVADTDQNGYLSPDEYGGFDPKPNNATYEAIDRDDNKMLTSAELEWYLKHVQRMAQLQVKVSAKNLTTSLFEHIDEQQNIDNRLTPREVVLASTERHRANFASSQYQVDAETDVINFIPASAMQMGDAAVSRPRAREFLRGPQWFQKMDRNRDGDLIWREFLGPRAIFDQIDANGDGFIVADEADRAE